MSVGSKLPRFRRCGFSQAQIRTPKLLALFLWSCVSVFCQGPAQVLTGYFSGHDLTSASYYKSVVSPNILDAQHTNGAARMNYLIYKSAAIENGICAVQNPASELSKSIGVASWAVMGQTDAVNNPSTALMGFFHQLQLLKHYNPNLKILISIGGSGAAAGFSQAASPANQSAFVTSCINTFLKGEFGLPQNYPGIFDGIDVDWEYPQAAVSGNNPQTDIANYLSLLQEFRTQLGNNGILTTAVGTTPIQYGLANSAPLTGLISGAAQNVNYLNVRTFDYIDYSSWLTGFYAPLYASHLPPAYGFNNTESPNNVDATIQMYTSAGIPPSQLLLGLPFDGVTWKSVSVLFSSPFESSLFGGSYLAYYQLAAQPYDCDAGTGSTACPSNWGSPLTAMPLAGAQEVWAILDSTTFNSFDDAGSIAAKVKYAQGKQLGGVMIDELTNDSYTNTLLTAVLADIPAMPRLWTAANAAEGVWAMTTTGAVYKFATTRTWASIPDTLGQLSVGSDGDTWSLSATGQIYHYQGNNWVRIPGVLSQIKVGSKTSVWGLTAAGAIYRWNGESFALIPGTLAQLGVGYDGDTWGLNGAGQIWHYTANNNKWAAIPGSLTQIAVGSGSNVWGLTAQGQVFQWTGSAWNHIQGALTQISVGEDGDVWGLNSAGHIWHYAGGNTWSQVSGNLSEIVVGSSSSVWGLSSDGLVFQYTSTGFVEQTGAYYF